MIRISDNTLATTMVLAILGEWLAIALIYFFCTREAMTAEKFMRHMGMSVDVNTRRA